MSRWDLLDWIRLIGALLLAISLWVCMANRPAPSAAMGTTEPAAITPATTAAAGLAISEPADGSTLEAGNFTLRGTGTAGEELNIFEGPTSLGKVTVDADGTWSKEVPSSSLGGAQTYRVVGSSGETSINVNLTAVTAGTGTCENPFSLSLSDGQTIAQPFRFGGEGRGASYTVTVKRGERVIGTKEILLDSSCGWSYESNPGVGPITYEVRETGKESEPAASTINLTIE